METWELTRAAFGTLESSGEGGHTPDPKHFSPSAHLSPLLLMACLLSVCDRRCIPLNGESCPVCSPALWPRPLGPEPGWLVVSHTEKGTQEEEQFWREDAKIRLY